MDEEIFFVYEKGIYCYFNNDDIFRAESNFYMQIINFYI